MLPRKTFDYKAMKAVMRKARMDLTKMGANKPTFQGFLNASAQKNSHEKPTTPSKPPTPSSRSEILSPSLAVELYQPDITQFHPTSLMSAALTVYQKPHAPFNPAPRAHSPLAIHSLDIPSISPTLSGTVGAPAILQQASNALASGTNAVTAAVKRLRKSLMGRGELECLKKSAVRFLKAEHLARYGRVKTSQDVVVNGRVERKTVWRSRRLMLLNNAPAAV